MNGMNGMTEVLEADTRVSCDPATFEQPNAAPKTFKEILEMLMYEELTRARIRDMEQAIGGQRSPSRGARRLAWWPVRKSRHSEHRSRRSSKIA